MNTNKHGRLSISKQPSNEAIEQVTLTTLMHERTSEAIAELALLTHEDFYNEFNRDVFDVIRRQYGQGKGADFVLIHDELRQSRPDCKDRLMALYGACPMIGNLPHYRQALRDLSAKRALKMQVALTSEALETGEDLSSAELRKAIEAVEMIGHNNGKKNALDRALEAIDSRIEANRNGELPGIPSGIDAIDRQTGGYKNGLHMIGAWSSCGKSSLIVTTILAALNAGKRVKLYTPDMFAEYWLGRFAQRWHDISSRDILNGSLSNEQREKIGNVKLQLQAGGLEIDEDDLSCERLVSDAVSTKDTYDMLVLDTLQRLHAEGDGIFNETREKMKVLHSLSKTIEKPLLVTCQARNPPESEEIDKVNKTRGTKSPKTLRRPTQNDLEGGRIITQNAQTVTLLWREDYGQQSKHMALAEIHLSKTQNGGGAKVHCFFDTNKGEFVER